MKHEDVKDLPTNIQYTIVDIDEAKSEEYGIAYPRYLSKAQIMKLGVIETIGFSDDACKQAIVRFDDEYYSVETVGNEIDMFKVKLVDRWKYEGEEGSEVEGSINE